MGTEPSSAPTSHQAWALSPAPPQQNKVSTSVGTEPSSAPNSKTNPWQVGLQCVRQSQLASVCSECVWLRALLVATRLQHVAACTGMFPTPRLRPRLQARLCPAPSLPLPPVPSTLPASPACAQNPLCRPRLCPAPSPPLAFVATPRPRDERVWRGRKLLEAGPALRGRLQLYTMRRGGRAHQDGQGCVRLVLAAVVFNESGLASLPWRWMFAGAGGRTAAACNCSIAASDVRCAAGRTAASRTTGIDGHTGGARGRASGSSDAGGSMAAAAAAGPAATTHQP